MFPAAHLPADQAGVLQDGDMPRDPRECHWQRVRQVGDPGITRPQRDQQRPTGGIGQGRVGAVQHGIFN